MALPVNIAKLLDTLPLTTSRHLRSSQTFATNPVMALLFASHAMKKKTIILRAARGRCGALRENITAWIKSHQELAQHPKTKRLARALKIKIPEAIGYLHLLWYFCLDYAQDGNLSVSDIDARRARVEDLADAMMWEGDPDEIIVALAHAGFIDTNWEKELRVHDWQEYGGRLLEMRQRNVEKQKKWRESQGNNAVENKPKLRAL